MLSPLSKGWFIHWIISYQNRNRLTGSHHVLISLLNQHNCHDDRPDTFPKKTVHKISKNHHLKFIEILIKKEQNFFLSQLNPNYTPENKRLTWNTPLEKEKHLGTTNFGVPMFVFEGCTESLPSFLLNFAAFPLSTRLWIAARTLMGAHSVSICCSKRSTKKS